MITKKDWTTLVLITLYVSLLSSWSYAGPIIELKKDVRQNQVGSIPSDVTFNIYDSETGATPSSGTLETSATNTSRAGTCTSPTRGCWPCAGTVPHSA